MRAGDIIDIITLRDNPEFLERSANWFHKKWNIPLNAYRDSIADCINHMADIPQWYIALNKNREIIAGAGVIKNDFHERHDLTPNVCALYVEKDYRGAGLATRLLQYICLDLYALGIPNAYLITDHVGFYEKCGWEFLTMVKCDNGEISRLYSKKIDSNDASDR